MQIYLWYNIYIYIYGFVLFCCAELVGAPRIIPPNHAPESYPESHHVKSMLQVVVVVVVVVAVVRK